MHSYEVLRQAADEVGVKVLAAKLRVSPALVYKWCQPSPEEDADASGARNPLDRLAEIVRVTDRTDLVSWLCHEAGGFFVQNPTPAATTVDAEVLHATQQLVGEFGQLLHEVSESMSDDERISPDEADKIRAHWQKLKSLAESFVVACERGQFGPRLAES